MLSLTCFVIEYGCYYKLKFCIYINYKSKLFPKLKLMHYKKRMCCLIMMKTFNIYFFKLYQFLQYYCFLPDFIGTDFLIHEAFPFALKDFVQFHQISSTSCKSLSNFKLCINLRNIPKNLSSDSRTANYVST